MTNHSTNNQGRNRYRIIGGEWRSRKLGFPGDVDSLRPTPDRVRETLFNWLQLTIAGARCLDLFAGSGALSFEALSRGAQHVTAVDMSPRATASLQANCTTLSCKDMSIVTADALQWLKRSANAAQYDIVFLDPPYKLDLLSECLGLLESGNLVKPGGVVYLESDRALESFTLPQNWVLAKSKKAGQVFYGVCVKQMI